MRKGRGTFLLKHRVLEFSMIVSKSLDRQELFHWFKSNYLNLWIKIISEIPNYKSVSRDKLLI